MRFMMLMISKGYESATPGTMPDAPAVAAMMKVQRVLVDRYGTPWMIHGGAPGL